MTELAVRRRIVVGVDGSLPSLFALRWAGREARLRSAELHAVIVDAEPTMPRAPYAPVRPVAFQTERWATANRILVDSIRTAFGAYPDVPVHEHLEEGLPAQVLARHAEDAELLVLGSRRQCEDPAPGLGATVRACVQVAGCPVVVIHQDDLLGLDPDRRGDQSGEGAAAGADRAAAPEVVGVK
jgi:nucleotide-binding universal stress UspA family protein